MRIVTYLRIAYHPYVLRIFTYYVFSRIFQHITYPLKTYVNIDVSTYYAFLCIFTLLSFVDQPFKTYANINRTVKSSVPSKVRNSRKSEEFTGLRVLRIATHFT